MEDEVNQSNRKWFFFVMALAGILTVAACHKKVAPAPPPPPPAPAAAPTASLTANPATIEQGQASTLSWTTQNATEVILEGIGKVGPSGSQLVTPTSSTTYRLTATGEGGSQEATARVTVTPPPPPETTTVPSLSDQELFARSVKDIYFDYDSYAVRPSDQATLQADAAFLKSHPNMRFTVEGHCDERGSTEYNLALGENRANAAKQALVNLGIPAGSIKTISYGKEKPVCNEHTEACWQQNRRAHFVLGQ
jgi:peptidoglycan-associated lipoprotein